MHSRAPSFIIVGGIVGAMVFTVVGTIMGVITSAVAGALVTGCSLDTHDFAVDEPRDGAAGTDTGAFASDSGVAVDTASPSIDSATSVDAAIACDESGAIRYAGHCYFVLAPAVSFDEAKAACASTTPIAHMVSITSMGEESTVGTLVGATDSWIGLTRSGGSPTSKTSFKWITGEAQSFDGWSIGEPNNSGSCARIRIGPSWADVDCATRYPAVCERE